MADYDVADIELRARDLVNEPAIDFLNSEEIQEFINEGQREIALVTMSLRKTSQKTTAASRWLSGTNLMNVITVENNTSRASLVQTTPAHLSRLPDMPVGFWYHNNETSKGVGIEPIPAAGTVMTVYYFDTPDPITIEVPGIQAKMWNLLVLYVASRCLHKENRFSEYQFVHSIYEQELAWYAYEFADDFIPDSTEEVSFV